jgi:regulator of sigma E protease
MTIIIFVVVLGILVFIHELGHFLTAKWIGVRVEKFSLGFGPKIIGFKRGDTEYMISAFPLGGYVKLTGEGEEDEVTGAPWELESRNFGEKSIIFASGSLMNIILAFLIMPVVFMIGMETPEFFTQKPVIGFVGQDSRSIKAGILPGDEILTINGSKTMTWEDALQQFAIYQKAEIKVSVMRNNKELNFIMPKVTDDEAYLGVDRLITPEIQKIRYGGPASKAGLQNGDIVLKIDDVAINDWNQMAEIIRHTKKDTLFVKVRRNGQEIMLNISPEMDKSLGYKIIGITAPPPKTFKKKFPFFSAIKEGCRENINLTSKLYDLLKKLFSGKASIKNLGGPIMIAQVTNDAYRQGISYLLYFMAFLSLQLGILNLLPIPILDGGRIFCFLLPELIIRRNISMKIKEISIQVSFGLLMLLMVLISYNDILRTGLVAWIIDKFH